MGSYLFNKLVSKDHPLRTLSEIAGFNELDKELAHLYSTKGQHAYPPSMMVRILILKYLYNTSDERAVQLVRDNIPCRMYAGISLDDNVPNPSDLTYFRRRLGDDNFKKIFDKTLRIARRNGLEFEKILLADSTHAEAKINQRTQGRTKDNNHNDPDAVFARKNKDKAFFGYKHHTAVESEHNLITAIHTTPGNIPDCKKLKDLVEDSLNKMSPDIFSADKGYDDEKLHDYLEENNIFSAIILKKNRLQTRDKTFKERNITGNHPNRYFKQYMDPRYEQGVSERYKVEQPYAEMKRYHGLGRSRYLGLNNNQIQASMTALVYNLKHILTAISTLTTRRTNRAFLT